MPLNIANIRKLARRMRRIRHEEHYDQNVLGETRSCGTAACLAGHAILMGGLKFNTYSDFNGQLAVDGGTCHAPRKKEEQKTWTVAKRLLGLSGDQASLVFTDMPEWRWPEPFAHRWKNRALSSRSTRERPSRIAADFLDAIADSNGAILKSV